MKRSLFISSLAVAAMLLAIVPAANADSLTVTGNFQAGNLPTVYDLTAGPYLLKFQVDMRGMNDSASGDTTHAYAEFGVRDVTGGNYNPDNKGVWLATDYDWAAGGLDPDPVGAPNQDLDDKFVLSKQTGLSTTQYDLPNGLATNHNINYAVWFDRDGVDQWQAASLGAVDGGTYNTGGVYNIEMLLTATTATTGTAFLKVNGLDQVLDSYSPNGEKWGMTFTGDMTQMQIFYGIWGYGQVSSATFSNVQMSVVPLPAAAWMGLSLLGCVGGFKGLKKRFGRKEV